MKAHTMGTVTAALLLIGSLLSVQADDKKEVKDPQKEAKDPLAEKYAAKEKEIGAALKSGLISKEIAEKILKEYERQLKADQLAEKYAAKEKEIGAALKSGLISKEIAEKILKEYERQLKTDQRRDQFRNRQAGGAIGDARARADKARDDARARQEEMRRNREKAFDPDARQPRGGFNRRDPFKNLDLTEEQQKAIAAIQQKKSEEQLEYKEMMKELDETFQKRMEEILTDEQKEKYKEMQTQRNQRFQPRRPADR